MDRLFLQAITLLTVFSTFTLGRPTPVEPGGRNWDPGRLRELCSREWESWSQKSRDRISEKLGYNDPDMKRAEAIRRQMEFEQCMDDEFSFRKPKGTPGPTVTDWFERKWGEEHLDEYMYIEDWCVGEAMRDPRMAEARGRRREFRYVTLLRWMERDRLLRREGLPSNPNDPEPRLAPQAQKFAISLDRGQRDKNTVPGASRLDIGRQTVEGLVQDVSRFDVGRMVKNVVQSASGRIKNPAPAFAMPTFNPARVGGLPIRAAG